MTTVDAATFQQEKSVIAISDNNVTQLISRAEKHISAQKYQLALEQLSLAKQLEPKNNYIQAIIERVHAMQNNSTLTSAFETDRYLSVTVGTEFEDGVKENDDLLSPAELKKKVRQLTSTAEKLLADGSINSAFESLMRAYLLDPVSPHVIACEQTVLPAWKYTRGQVEAPSIPNQTTSERKPMTNPTTRLEFLKKEKEAERLEKERSIWREASKPILTFGEEGIENNTGHREETPEPPKIERGLFSKLKLGKFLG